MTHASRWILLAVVGIIVGCDEPSLSGRWTGGSADATSNLDLTLATPRDGEVSGSGVLEYLWGDMWLSPQVVAYGVYDPPHIALELAWGQSARRRVTGESELGSLGWEHLLERRRV
jgi:hypothetical protein